MAGVSIAGARACRFGAMASPHTDINSMTMPMSSALTYAADTLVTQCSHSSYNLALETLKPPAKRRSVGSIGQERTALVDRVWSAIVNTVSPPQTIKA